MRTIHISPKFPRKYKKKLTKIVKSKGYDNIKDFYILEFLLSPAISNEILNNMQELLSRQLDRELLEHITKEHQDLA